MEINFIRFLEQRLADDPPKRKGARTRLLLLIAAANVLSEQGYHSLRLRDVTDRAGLAEGTIYAHFGDRPRVINEVMGTFLNDFLWNHLAAYSNLENRGRRGAAYSSLSEAMRHWFLLARENQGLMRSSYQMSDDEPTFASQIQLFNFNWTRQVTLAYLQDDADADMGAALLLTYAIKYMMNEMTRRLIIFPDPMLLGSLEKMGADDDVVADALSLIWLRLLYPDEPMPTGVTGLLKDVMSWIMPQGAGEASIPVPQIS